MLELWDETKKNDKRLITHKIFFFVQVWKKNFSHFLFQLPASRFLLKKF